MAFLVLSDIHSNLEALVSVLEDAEGDYDHILCLGDLVGYGADPNPIVDWARGKSTIGLLAQAPITEVIRGNHDRACCGLDDLENFNPAARAAAMWTRKQLLTVNRTYLEELTPGPLSIRYEGDAADPDSDPEDRVFDLVHGSPVDEDQYVSRLVDAVTLLDELDRQLTFFGHTHLQGGFLLTPDTAQRIPVAAPGPEATGRLAIEIESDCFYLINPGSVGQPRDKDPRAAYAIYTAETKTVEYRRVQYDIDKAAKKIRAAGLPEGLAARLYQGT
ncbi:MAG: metallophosphoesterase family protein [Acidobacteriota bacterium]